MKKIMKKTITPKITVLLHDENYNYVQQLLLEEKIRMYGHFVNDCISFIRKASQSSEFNCGVKNLIMDEIRKCTNNPSEENLKNIQEYLDMISFCDKFSEYSKVNETTDILDKPIASQRERAEDLGS